MFYKIKVYELKCVLAKKIVRFLFCDFTFSFYVACEGSLSSFGHTGAGLQIGLSHPSSGPGDVFQRGCREHRTPPV